MLLPCSWFGLLAKLARSPSARDFNRQHCMGWNMDQFKKVRLKADVDRLEMRRGYEECRLALFDALSRTLAESADFMNALKRNRQGELEATGLSLDLFPWHELANLSLRMYSDFPAGDQANRYHSGDWKHHAFSEQLGTTYLDDAGQLIGQFYRAGDDNDRLFRTHLVFQAGAEALLDSRIPEQLRDLGINAPNGFAELFGHKEHCRFFEYVVCDEDGTLTSNYCDVVRSTLLTNRLLDD